MAVGSKSFPQDVPSEPWVSKTETEKGSRTQSHTALWLQIAIGYLLIEIVLWTPLGPFHTGFMLLAAVCILLFVAFSNYSTYERGLRLPAARGLLFILTMGLVATALIVTIATLRGGPIPANPGWPKLNGAWQYAVWATVQQFILQTFFYLRLESMAGSKRAVWVTALLFAAAHIPNPVLTVFTLLGALFFCEMFRRYRSIYPLGVVHAMLGLSLAASFPDALLRHMRVGLGYLQFH